MAERLGTALQKLLQRFESASDLSKMPLQSSVGAFSLGSVLPAYYMSAFSLRLIRFNHRITGGENEVNLS